MYQPLRCPFLKQHHSYSPTHNRRAAFLIRLSIISTHLSAFTQSSSLILSTSPGNTARYHTSSALFLYLTQYSGKKKKKKTYHQHTPSTTQAQKQHA
jgi:histone deacetylase complex regulatory component SIN3